MKLGLLGDIHGNAPALSAVLEDMSHHRPDFVVQLGDAMNGPVDPPGVAKILRQQAMIHIQGNGDRMVASVDESSRSRSAQFARALLDTPDLDWMGSWPLLYQDKDFVACHGSPSSDTEYLLEEVRATGVSLRAAEEIRQRVSPINSPLIMCAHTHIPRVVQLDRETLVVNPGSVGLPAYTDEAPVFHRMETGSPHARYALAEFIRGAWKVALWAIPYDWETAARLAESNGFPDWAFSLRTGYAI